MKKTAYHVPEEVGWPINSGVDTTHKLQVFGAWDPLLNQNHHKTGRNKGHGKNNTGSNQYVSLTVKPETRGDCMTLLTNTKHAILKYVTLFYKHT